MPGKGRHAMGEIFQTRQITAARCLQELFALLGDRVGKAASSISSVNFVYIYIFVNSCPCFSVIRLFTVKFCYRSERKRKYYNYRCLYLYFFSFRIRKAIVFLNVAQPRLFPLKYVEEIK